MQWDRFYCIDYVLNDEILSIEINRTIRVSLHAAASLFFPMRWSLQAKWNQPMIGIHKPVDGFMNHLVKRVADLFKSMSPDAPGESRYLLQLKSTSTVEQMSTDQPILFIKLKLINSLNSNLKAAFFTAHIEII